MILPKPPRFAPMGDYNMVERSGSSGHGRCCPQDGTPIRNRSFRRLFPALLASTALLPAVLVAGPARADCTTAGDTTTCNTSSPNPYTATVGTGQGDDDRTVTVETGAEISAGNANAISLGNGATITVEDGATVRNDVTTSNGNFGTGANTIEFEGNGTLYVGEGAQVISEGPKSNVEAVNVHGFGNKIENHGTIHAENNAAIWFENWPGAGGTGKNEVDNFGVISTAKNGGDANVFGAQDNSTGIVFKNRTGAEVHGHLHFADGDDELEFFANSLVTGDIDGGGGTDDLTLNGADGSSDILAGDISNFETLLKTGAGKWTATGTLKGFTIVTVDNGTLALTGDNTDFNGKVVVNADGVMEARAQSLPLTTLGGPDVNNDGLVRFTQPDDGTYTGQIAGTGAVEKTGAGILTLDPTAASGNTYSGGTYFNEGTIAVAADNALGASNGALVFDGGALRFDASFDLSETREITLMDGGGVFDTQGFTSTLSQGLSGTGGFAKKGEGTLILNGDNSHDGGTRVDAGALVVGDADHSGASLSGAGDVLVSSGATLGGYGRVVGDVANNGTIAVANALAALSSGPTGTFTVEGDLANNGRIQLGGESVGNRLVIGGDYVGNGDIYLNTVLGDDGSATDLVVIDGGSATGNTALHVTNAGGLGALTTGDGIRVVDAINGATTDSEAFALANRLAAGAYEYELYYGGRATTGGDPGDQDWYLRSHKPGEDDPLYRDEVPLYSALPSLATLYGFAMLDTLHERVGETFQRPRRADGADGGTVASGGWGRVLGVYGKHKSDDFVDDGAEFDYTFGAVQTGLDLYRREGRDGSRDSAGFYLGVGHVDADVDKQYGGKAGTADLDAYSLGVYWTHFGATGWYLDAVAQGTYYDAKAHSERGQKLDTDGYGLIASLEAGYPVRLDEGLVLEPQAQLAYQHVHMDSGKDDYGRVSYENADTLLGRLGARLAKTWQTTSEGRPLPSTAWLRVNVWNQFLNDPDTTFTTLDGDHPASVSSPLSGTWGEIGIGGSAFVTETVSLFAVGSYNHALDDSGMESWDAKAGLTVVW